MSLPRELASSFMKQTAADETVLFRAMVAPLSGAFEQFIRRVVRDSVLAINAATSEYDHLDEQIRAQNLYRTGMAFQTIYEPVDYLQLEYESLAKNIGTCITGSKTAALNAEAFTIFLSIISPKNLSDALKRIGLELDWDDLGRVQALRQILDKRDTRETAKAIQDYLKRFARTRNQIAHSGAAGALVTENDFRQFLSFFRTLARSLVPLVEAGVSRYTDK